MVEQVKLDEFCGESLGEECKEKKEGDEREQLPRELEFTGNWFIDAGILGFVNLMEEVYGWSLKKLQEKIKKEPQVVYYWYFPIGYVCHVVREVQTKKGLEKIKQINDVISKIPAAPQIADGEDLFEKAWEWIMGNEPLIGETKKGKSKIKRIKMSWSGRYRLLTNFPLFQPKYDLERQKNIFMSLLRLGGKEIKDEVLVHIDKTTSKFLPSASDFPNISYSKSCITMDILLSLDKRASMFILTYPLAFVSEVLNSREYQIMFYSPELAFTYDVSRKLKMYLNNISKENLKMNIFKITWKAIIDSISELESLWSLENMYIIKIKPPTGQKQDLDEVEYIGIPKLQASIVVDDVIREALNKSIPTLKKKKKKDGWVWILEEFIKNKPLLPYIIAYVHGLVADKWTGNEKSVGKYTLITALAVDAVIKEMKSSKVYGESLFNETFFSDYRDIVAEVKQKISSIYYSSQLALKIVEKTDRDKITTLLFGKVKGRNKYGFANTLLKYISGKIQQKNEIKGFVNYLFNNILHNDTCWENYALPIVIGLLKGGEKNE